MLIHCDSFFLDFLQHREELLSHPTNHRTRFFFQLLTCRARRSACSTTASSLILPLLSCVKWNLFHTLSFNSLIHPLKICWFRLRSDWISIIYDNQFSRVVVGSDIQCCLPILIIRQRKICTFLEKNRNHACPPTFCSVIQRSLPIDVPHIDIGSKFYHRSHNINLLRWRVQNRIM